MHKATFKSDDGPAGFRESVASGIEQCLSKWDRESYRLSMLRPTGEDWRIVIDPTKPGCAGIELVVCSHDVDVATGHEVSFNIPHDVEIPKKEDAVVAFVVEVVEAVLSGKLVEKVLRRGRHAYGCQFRLPVGNTVVAQTRVDIPRWMRCFWKSKRTRVFRYREY